MFFFIQNQMVNTNGTFKDVFWLGKKVLEDISKYFLYHLLRWQAKKGNF